MGKEQMEITFNSRKLNRKFEFMRPSGSEYLLVRMTIPLSPFPEIITDWVQPCEGGAYSGGTLTYCGNDYSDFKTVCHRWYRKHIRGE
jgi:hypothetical protein